MTLPELEQYLHNHIPLSRAMQVRVIDIQTHSVTLGAPLAPNINHRDTVFGGSASAVAILSAWSLLHTRCSAEGLTHRLVIQRNTMTYDAPILGDFTATAALTNTNEWDFFLRMLKRKGKARIAVTSMLRYDNKEVGRLDGEFVAL